MNGTEVLRIVDAIHRDKNIDKEIVFEGIEQAILSAARKHYGEERDIRVVIERENGQVDAWLDGEEIPADEIEMLGRISAQTAKQVMIQKIREAERDSLFDEFEEQRGQLVTGVITRLDHGVATVNIGKVEALLPRSEQVPGESHRVNERVRAVILDVRKSGSRVKIILSRVHPELVRRLFEVEIPEVSERVIEVRSLAREAGYRSKVAVSCYDNSIDCVGACVGVRGSRIKTIVDELAGERIDIVRWNDSLQVLIPNALQPAEVEDVILCPMLGRVIVLVRDDQLSLAIGKKGQNVRLASKLVGWDIEVMTRDELDEQLDRSVEAFSVVPHVTEELAEMLVSQGFFSFDDLSVIEPDQLAELGGLTAEQCDEIVEYADRESEREEQEAERRKQFERQARAAGIQPPPARKPTTSGESASDEESAVAEEAAASESDETASAVTGSTEEPTAEAAEDVAEAEAAGEVDAAEDEPSESEEASEVADEQTGGAEGEADDAAARAEEPVDDETTSTQAVDSTPTAATGEGEASDDEASEADRKVTTPQAEQA